MRDGCRSMSCESERVLYKGVVTQTVNSIAYVWPIDVEAKQEVLVDERSKSFAEKLQIGEWIEFGIAYADTAADYQRIEEVLPTRTPKKDVVWVKTLVSFPSEKDYPVDKIAHSDHLGRIGIFGSVGRMDERGLYNVWVTRTPASRAHLEEIYGTHWMIVNQTVIPENFSKLRKNPYSINLKPHPNSAPFSTQEFSQSNQLEVWDRSLRVRRGLVASVFPPLVFIVSGEVGDGLVHFSDGAANLSVGDWIEFIPSYKEVVPGKVHSEECEYRIQQFRVIAPLFPSRPCRKTVEVDVTVHVPRNYFKGTSPLLADWFGAVDDDWNVVRKLGETVVGRNLSAKICRRRPGYLFPNRWMISEAQLDFLSESSNAKKPLESSPSFEWDALRYLMNDNGVRSAVRAYDGELFDAISNYLPLP